MESSSSGSSRRARPSVIGSSAPSCMVDECSADLGQCRDYHRRHKVCEFHAKTPIVYVKGQEQRFCQQCSRSRFHSLVEFDDRKRSCRKRLEGHNLRRRKPRRDFVPVNVPRLYTSSQGTRYIHFDAPQIPLGPAISEPLISRCSREMFSDGLNRVVDSDCAHSLLSSPPAETQEINMVRPELISSLNYSWTRVETRPVGSVLVSDSRNANLPGPNKFHVQPDGTSATGSQPTLSFSWE